MLKSWFSFTSRGKASTTHARDGGPQDALSPLDKQGEVPFSHDLGGSPVPDAWSKIPEDRLRPVQYPPSRLATLYVTPSERNLYLAAMSQLDEGPPPLPLWAEAAPELPKVQRQDPFSFVAPPTPRTSRNTAYPGAGGGMGGWPPQHQGSASFDKLVTSPEFAAGGLTVMDEFRSATHGGNNTQHALVSLISPSTIKVARLSVPALVALDEAISSSWPMGIISRSESITMLKQKQAGQVPRNGRRTSAARSGTGPAARSSSEYRSPRETGLANADRSVRLILVIMTALGANGYSLVGTVQAGKTVKDTHNLVFAYYPQIAPPAFFAVSLPLPDRISLISPPTRSTPALISSLRSAILSQSCGGATQRHASRASSSDGGTAWKGDIKLEGWVHKGVYRFWLGGMRRTLSGVLKRDIADSLHPKLMLAVVEAMAGAQFGFIASVPLFPLGTRRDILFFCSLPESGLDYRDTFISLPTVPPSPRAMSASAPPVPPLPLAYPNGQDVGGSSPYYHTMQPRSPTATKKSLPWTSVLAGTPPRGDATMTRDARGQTESPHTKRTVGSDSRAGTPGSPSRGTVQGMQSQQASDSEDGAQPLIPANTHSPRQKNLLRKFSNQKKQPVPGAQPGGTEERLAEESEPGTQRAIKGRSGVRAEQRASKDEWCMVETPRNSSQTEAAEPIVTRPSPPRGQTQDQSRDIRIRRASSNPFEPAHASPHDQPFGIVPAPQVIPLPEPRINGAPVATYTTPYQPRASLEVRPRASMESAASVYMDAPYNPPVSEAAADQDVHAPLARPMAPALQTQTRSRSNASSLSGTSAAAGDNRDGHNGSSSSLAPPRTPRSPNRTVCDGQTPTLAQGARSIVVSGRSSSGAPVVQSTSARLSQVGPGPVVNGVRRSRRISGEALAAAQERAGSLRTKVSVG